MKAVIMAGGKGTRLRPLTCNTPKPMVPLLDRPVMEYTIKLLKSHGITEIAVTVQYLPEVIRKYFGDGSEFGVHLHYFEEDAPLGTAGSVKNAEDFLDESFIVISGDALTDFDLSKAIAFHQEKKATATLVLTHVESPLEYGVVMTNDAGRIVRFLEKPSWGEVFSDTVNTGIYILETEVFNYMDRAQEFDFSKDLFPILMEHEKILCGYIADGYWSDIGNLAQYRQTQFDMLDGMVHVTIPGKEIKPGVWIGDDVYVAKTARLFAPLYIGQDSVVGDHVDLKEYNVIGSGTIIKNKAFLEKAVLWKNNYVEQQVEIKGATICRNNAIRSGAVVSDGSIIGDGCHIGAKSIIQPDVKIFPNKLVESHTVLSHSLIFGEQTKRSLFGYFGVQGTCNVDFTSSFVHRIALAYGSTVKVGESINLSHDSSPFSELMVDSFSAGLHASGVHTYYFGTVTSSVSRYNTYHLDCAGAVHIRQMPYPLDDQFVIEFLDQEGLPINKAAERKIENAYYQEDFRLIMPTSVGMERKYKSAPLNYRESLLRSVNKEDIQDMGFKVILEYDFRNLKGIIPELLESLGCKVIQIGLNATSDELQKMVKANHADFGVKLDSNGQHIILVTNEGEVLEEEILYVLQMMIQLRIQEGPLFVPVYVPNMIETLGEQRNRKVIRTKVDPRSIMESCQNNGFHIYLDGIFTLLNIMQMMTEENSTLTELVNTIPNFTLLKKKVHCPWAEKGKVMRFLMEETKDKKVELIDGIKIFHDHGWTLILPDNNEPIFQVFANADNHQDAEELASTYTKKIQDYRAKVIM